LPKKNCAKKGLNQTFIHREPAGREHHHRATETGREGPSPDGYHVFDDLRNKQTVNETLYAKKAVSVMRDLVPWRP